MEVNHPLPPRALAATVPRAPGLIHSTLPPRQDPDFAEVLSDLSAQELQWLVQGQLRIMAETEGRHARQLAGTVTTRRSCDSEHRAGTLGCRGMAVLTPMPISPTLVPLSPG